VLIIEQELGFFSEARELIPRF